MKPEPSLCVTRESDNLTSAIGEAAIANDASPAEGKRRRLVRGAVALAPLVLTLRSGALAAASCTGVKIASASTKLDQPQQGEILNAPGVVAGDVCVQAQTLTACSTSPGKVETLSNLNVNNSEPVVTRNGNGGGWLSCGNPSQFVGENVAILSSQAASSMGVAQG